MSVNSNDQSAKGASSAGSASSTSRPAVNAYEASRIGSFFQRSISRHGTGEVLAQWEKAARDLIEKNGMTDVNVILLNKEVDAVALSTVIFAIQYDFETIEAGRTTNETKAVAFSLILEGSAEPLQDKYETIANTQVASKLVASDMYGKDYVDAVSARVAQELNLSPNQIVDATFAVVPSEANPEDPATVNQYLFHLESAILQIADVISGDTRSRFNLAFLPKTTRIKASVSYNEASRSAVTAGGLPVRSDISIVTTGQDVLNGDPKALVGGSVSNPITAVHGFVDLQRINPATPVFGQPQTNQAFKPVFVVTRFESQLNGNSLELQLFALSSLAVINGSRGWAGQFKPTSRYQTPNGECDLKDIGAIGNRWTPVPGQAPVGRFDTKSNAFDDQEFIKLISASIEEYPLYAIDVAKGDELYWVNAAFLVASNPANPGYESARKAIIDAANALTNGAFAKVWNSSNEALFQYSGNQVHLGYYTTKDNVRHDLRELDYLAIENVFGVTDPGTVLAWQATFDNIAEPLALRLQRRFAILESITGSTARVKDFAVRVYANPNFIRALIDACVAVGLHIAPENVAQFYGQSTTYNPVAQGLGGGAFNSSLTQNASSFNSGFNNNATFSRFN